MEIENEFQKIKFSEDIGQINNFLITLGMDPKSDYLKYVDYFLARLDKIEEVKINLFYVLGKLGNRIDLDDRYVKFLEQQFYRSDRWERKEIIIALKSILNQKNLTKGLTKLVLSALSEEYIPIRLETLHLLNNVVGIDNIIQYKLLSTLNIKNHNYIANCIELLNKLKIDANKLFSYLKSSNLHSNLNKTTIKNLLLILSSSINELENFHALISKSGLKMEYKELFLKEIDTMIKILLRSKY